MTSAPLCFVVVPSGFEQIAPAVADAGLEAVRAARGLDHAPTRELLILAEFAVVDVQDDPESAACFALGVRHAAHPHATVRVTPPYDRAAITEALRHARQVGNRPTDEIDRLKTDTFREQASYSTEHKARLERARNEGPPAVAAVERDLEPFEDVEAGVLVDLMLSYRAVSAWAPMIALIERLPPPLRRTLMVREQHAFALNRDGRDADAEAELTAIIAEHGPSSETCSLLGRVYKDRDDLPRAIAAYRAGFEADWRDAYPGINAVTLMEINGAADPELIPLVRYANRRRIDAGGDYWDHATRLELGVIARDREEADAGARDALAAVRERWEPESTANNLSLIRVARAARGEQVEWADAIERRLNEAAA